MCSGVSGRCRKTRAPSSTTTGTVTEVGQVADTSSGVATFPVTISFTDTTGDFNAGATVQVDITYAEVTDVVQVPSFAVTTSGGTSTVTVSVDGEEQPRTVEAGNLDDRRFRRKFVVDRHLRRHREGLRHRGLRPA